ncbi:MAG: hypothetical protein GWO20_05990 [Candidatus Korarchaeota archaeon]|nr:hypothetical protein [Candidatus Korarchaeota archaeon]NIU82986.1 hypothetical protein [Candidatus Thorarchaeota archaeon]NIW13420.1 hypothetical protein [Candidatus Thorarchaeota archaeon]NIW51519.1 hypothetical protein [Candidatus Korarchaeota archaeon]
MYHSRHCLYTDTTIGCPDKLSNTEGKQITVDIGMNKLQLQDENLAEKFAETFRENIDKCD